MRMARDRVYTPTIHGINEARSRSEDVIVIIVN